MSGKTKTRFNLEALNNVPQGQKTKAYEEIFGSEDRQQNQNALYRLKNSDNPKLTANQIATICRHCGISLNEFFIND